MSCSKPLPPFTFDLLCYCNRDQLERFMIVCRPLKNIIDRYFNSKPYRVFDQLKIHGGMYALLMNKSLQWHPNRDDYTVQQFFAGQKCSINISSNPYYYPKYYSFAEMRPYLGPTVRVRFTSIFVGYSVYNPEHIAEMESISYLWRDNDIEILHENDPESRILAKHFQSILSSPTILQCRKLTINNAHFSFKDFKVLYTVKAIETRYDSAREINPSYWPEFLEQPGSKPVVSLQYICNQHTVNALECLKKVFSSAVVPSAFKVLFKIDMENMENWDGEEPLIEFRETNKISRENLELKKGPPTNCESFGWESIEKDWSFAKDFNKDFGYTLERFSI